MCFDLGIRYSFGARPNLWGDWITGGGLPLLGIPFGQKRTTAVPGQILQVGLTGLGFPFGVFGG